MTDASPPCSASPEQPTPVRVGAGAWWMLGVLFFLYVLSFLARMTITIVAPDIKAATGLNDTELSIILGPAFAFTYSVFGLPLGWAVDRFDRRAVIFVGMIVFGAATALSGLAAGFVTLLLTRMFVGFGEAALSPAAYSLLTDRFPKRLLTMAISIYTMGIKVGSAAALAAGGLMVAVVTAHPLRLPAVGELQPWQAVLFLSGAPALVLGVLAFSFAEPERRKIAGVAAQASHADAGVWRFVWRDRRLVIPILAGFTLVGMYGAVLVAWIPSYMARAFHWKASQYGPALGALNFALSFTLIFTGAAIDWLHARGMKDAHLRFYLWLLAASLPVTAGMYFLTDPWLFLACYGVLLIAATPVIGYASTILQLITPMHLRGRIAAVFMFIFTVIGGTLGPLAVGFLNDQVFHDPQKLGWSIGLIGATTCPLALIVLATALKPLRARLGEPA